MVIVPNYLTFLPIFLFAPAGGSVNRDKTVGPCQACKALVHSVESGMNSTKTKDVFENLCTDVKFGREQCKELATNNVNLLKEWKENNETIGDLHNFFCIEKLKVCCPLNHYGPSCTPCPTCSGHGRCKGNGTRKGNGACVCDSGYIGESCNSCAKMHYEAYRDDTKLICSPCHKACDGGCSGAGPRNCQACKEGWETDEESGCLEINECLTPDHKCTNNSFCVNTEGSYVCYECDRSCEGCHGDGPDMCEKCAEGFKLIDKLCIDSHPMNRDRKVDFARYMTYFGLCVSTCIIFQKNMAIASIIGVAVGVYIATSEYMLGEL